MRSVAIGESMSTWPKGIAALTHLKISSHRKFVYGKYLANSYQFTTARLYNRNRLSLFFSFFWSKFSVFIKEQMKDLNEINAF